MIVEIDNIATGIREPSNSVYKTLLDMVTTEVYEGKF